MGYRSYILVNLILSSCTLEYAKKEYLKDAEGYPGISYLWHISCPAIWSFDVKNGLNTCLPKRREEANCEALSLLYNGRKAKELYVNILTETRKCWQRAFSESCTGKFNVSIHYLNNENRLKSFILTSEIPKKRFDIKKHFFYANDTVSFSVDQNYKNFKLGFQAPFYCGTIISVSVHYYLCPIKTSALVDFPEVPAPSKLVSPYVSAGACTKNSVKKRDSLDLSMKCYYNGTYEVVGSCECEAGYTNFYDSKICKG